MNNVYFTDSKFINSMTYQKFIEENSGKGNLKIHAYAFNEAMPVNDLHVVVGTILNDEKVIFFDGYTDSSGMIEKLSLPAPEKKEDNMEIPKSTKYFIEAIKDDIKSEFSVDMYDGICVVQNINFTPGSGLNGN